MVNGIGGSGDFLRNGKLSIMHCPSTRFLKYLLTIYNLIDPQKQILLECKYLIDINYY